MLLPLLCGGCREGVAPFTPVERGEAAPPHQITFGYGNDTDPRWSPGGDTLLYHTDLFGSLPESRGVLLTIDPRGGAAAPMFGGAQATVGRPLVTPAMAPDGERVAYMDLVTVDVPGACLPFVTCEPIQPLLGSAMLRVRGRDYVGPIIQDMSIEVEFPGTDPAHRIAGPGPYDERFFPFQAQHRSEAAMLFRPSWSADGERIAFSDGLSIRIWDVGEAEATVIPGTMDGVSAAWSMNGEWIAFTTLERADSQVINCTCGSPSTPAPSVRTIYTVGARTLVIVRPDGSERRELGPGEDPAWSPDNQFIFVRRDDRIVRVAVSDGAAEVVEGTTRGRAPAISPDGTTLAFARRKDQPVLDYDIWITVLER